MPPPRILIVEDETVLRAAMARGLAKLPAVVDEAATVAEAVAHLDRAVPAVVISDLDLPDGSGIELIGELGKRRVRVPVVFVSAYIRAFRAQIPPHADVELREKPVALDELRALVRDRLGPRASEAPPPAPFAAADYIQLACLGKHSVVIEVRGRGRNGRVLVVGGEVWHAEDERGDGLDAFRRLVFADDAEVHCHTLATAAGHRTIEGKWEALLMDSARIVDERGRRGGTVDEVEVELALDDSFDLSDQVSWPPEAQAALTTGRAPRLGDGSEDGVPRFAVPRAGDEFERARDDALDALLAHDYPTAARAFARAHALRPDDRLVAANLERLASLGYTVDKLAQEDFDA